MRDKSAVKWNHCDWSLKSYPENIRLSVSGNLHEGANRSTDHTGPTGIFSVLPPAPLCNMIPEFVAYILLKNIRRKLDLEPKCLFS